MATAAAGDLIPGNVDSHAPGTHLTWVVVLRGFAALWVYAFHLWNAMGGMALTFGFAGGFTFGLRSLFHAGYQGVDLFFVLSGFVIAWPYVQRRQQKLDRYQLADFYARRYFRIAPVYYVSLIVVVILIHLHWLHGLRSVADILAHFLFLQNFVREWVVSLRAVYWTLPTEMSFYLLFPLLLRSIDRERPWRFAAFFLAVALCYRGFTGWSTLHGGMSIAWTAGYLPGRIDQFACGMAAACILARRSAAPPISVASVWLSAALAVVGLAWIARHAGGLDEWFAVGPSVAAVLIAVFIVAMGRLVQARGHAAAPPQGVIKRVAARLGEASLGIYLWHTVFIDLAAEIALRQGLTAGQRILLLLATIPVTIAVSLYTWRTVEAPWIAYARAPRWQAKLRRFVDRVSPRRTLA